MGMSKHFALCNFFRNLSCCAFRHGNPGDYVWGPGGLDAIITQLLNNVEGSGPPPADKEKIDRLPTVKVTASQVGKLIRLQHTYHI